MFHRVDDPMAIPSSLYFQRAKRLIYRDGALRAALMRDYEAEEAADPTPATAASSPALPADALPIQGLMPGAQVVRLDDAAAAAALTRTPDAVTRGFPTVAYLHD